jgi:hypothetical protein
VTEAGASALNWEGDFFLQGVLAKKYQHSRKLSANKLKYLTFL